MASAARRQIIGGSGASMIKNRRHADDQIPAAPTNWRRRRVAACAGLYPQVTKYKFTVTMTLLPILYDNKRPLASINPFSQAWDWHWQSANSANSGWWFPNL